MLLTAGWEKAYDFAGRNFLRLLCQEMDILKRLSGGVWNTCMYMPATFFWKVIHCIGANKLVSASELSIFYLLRYCNSDINIQLPPYFSNSDINIQLSPCFSNSDINIQLPIDPLCDKSFSALYFNLWYVSVLVSAITTLTYSYLQTHCVTRASALFIFNQYYVSSYFVSARAILTQSCRGGGIPIYKLYEFRVWFQSCFRLK